MTRARGLQLPVSDLDIQKHGDGCAAGKWLYDQIVGMPAAGCPEWQTSVGPLFYDGLSGDARVHQFSDSRTGRVYAFAERVVDSSPYGVPLHFRLLKVTLPTGACCRVADPGLPSSEILTAPAADEKALCFACERLGALATADANFAAYMDILQEAAPAVGPALPSDAEMERAATTMILWNQL